MGKEKTKKIDDFDTETAEQYLGLKPSKPNSNLIKQSTSDLHNENNSSEAKSLSSDESASFEASESKKSEETVMSNSNSDVSYDHEINIHDTILKEKDDEIKALKDDLNEEKTKLMNEKLKSSKMIDLIDEKSEDLRKKSEKLVELDTKLKDTMNKLQSIGMIIKGDQDIDEDSLKEFKMSNYKYNKYKSSYLNLTFNGYFKYRDDKVLKEALYVYFNSKTISKTSYQHTLQRMSWERERKYFREMDENECLKSNGLIRLGDKEMVGSTFLFSKTLKRMNQYFGLFIEMFVINLSSQDNKSIYKLDLISSNKIAFRNYIGCYNFDLDRNFPDEIDLIFE